MNIKSNVINKMVMSNILWLAYILMASEVQAGFIRDNSMSYMLGVNTSSGILQSKIRTDTPDNALTLASEVVLVSKVDFAVHEVEFEISQAGTYTASLRDFEFPNSLASLSLDIYSAGATPGLSKITMSQNGTLTFEAEAGTYLATLNAFAGNNGLSRFGLYGFEIGSTAVPLPAAILFFLSGLTLLGFSARRRKLL